MKQWNRGARFAAITPNDSVTLAQLTDAVYFGNAGTAAVSDEFGSNTTLTVAAGALLPLRILGVRATGTTATGIIGLNYLDA